MSKELQSLKEMLLEGIRLSMQSSYARRSPTSVSIDSLTKTRHGLREFLNRDLKNKEAWRFLSLAEEGLLNFQEAITFLETSLSFGNRRPIKDIKRLALLKESYLHWNTFPLSPAQLRALGDYLVMVGASEERNKRTLEFTMQWMKDNNIPLPDVVLDALKMRGGQTDFMVLHNVVRC